MFSSQASLGSLWHPFREVLPLLKAEVASLHQLGKYFLNIWFRSCFMGFSSASKLSSGHNPRTGRYWHNCRLQSQLLPYSEMVIQSTGTSLKMLTPPSLLQEMVAVGMEEGHSHRWGQCVHGVFHFTRELRSDKVSNARRPDYGPTKLFAWIHIPPSLGRHEDGWPLPWGLRALGLASWNIQILEDLILRPGVSNCNITKWFNPSLANEPQHHVFEWTANFHIPFLCLLY